MRIVQALLGLLLLGLAAVQAVQAAPPPLEAFFERPLLSAAVLAPDGRRVAMRLSAPGARARLVVLELETLKPTVVASFNGADIGHFEWVNAERLVFDLDTDLVGPGLVEFLRGLYAVNADGSGFRQLVKSRNSFVESADDAGLLPPDTRLQQRLGGPASRDVLVALARRNDRRGADYIELQRLDTVNGRATAIETPLHSFAWRFDAQGTLRLVTTHENHRATVLLRQPEGAWKKIAEYEELGPGWMNPAHVGPDGTLYVEAPHQGRSALFTLDPATGRLSAQPLAASPRFDLHPQFISNDRALLGLRYLIDAEVTQWLDADMKALQAAIDERLPATANRLSVPQRGDAPWVLVEAQADVRPYTAYLYHRGTKKLTSLGSSHPRIDSRAMGRTDLASVRARDGREIPVWITLPAGPAPQGPRPMVVLLHGGPWLRGMHWRWDAEVQFLASRGYVVLQPEFRGSTGYGGAHFEAGFGQWGRAMQDDVADAAKWAVAQGHADGQRICLAGASYGGYATLMGLANDPALFRCGVAWVGVTDVQLLFSAAWSDMTERAKEYGMKRMIGDPVADAERLQAVSPVHQAARIRQPLLLAYGRWDTRVPIEHGERLREALKPHNTQVDWVVYPEEGHGWQRVETRLDFWARVEAFLARQLAP